MVNNNNLNNSQNSINTTANIINSTNTVTTTNTTNTTTTSNTTSPQVVEISIINMQFPSVTTIKKGQTVRWTNNDGFAHTVTFTDITLNSGNLPSGGKFEATFNDLGTFNYKCSIHPSMTGKIVVE